MTKLGGLLARNTPLPESPTPSNAAEPDNPLDLDEELFSARGSQLGAENEALRNLLADASTKISELDSIKSAVGRLVDPVSKALRAIEAEQAEKIALQTVLADTRAAYNKLRSDCNTLEKKLTASDGECRTLRQELTVALAQLKSAENAKAEIAIDVAARGARIAELESHLARESGERKVLADDNHRLTERLINADKRVFTLESDLNGHRQRLAIADDEKRAQQAMLERASSETAHLTRKLAESEAGCNAALSRLRQVEASFAELDIERNRLANTLDEINERHGHELTSQRMRSEALQARVQAGEKLLGEARAHMLARAEEKNSLDRRLSEITVERDSLKARLAELEAERSNRDSTVRELEHARNSLNERVSTQSRTISAKEVAIARAEEAITALTERFVEIEQARLDDQQKAELAADELKAALRREQMERSVVDGALETARKDFSRAMRELMALQRKRQAAEPAPEPQAANAA